MAYSLAMESPSDVVAFFAALGSMLCLRSVLDSLAHARNKIGQSAFPEYTKHSMKSGNAFAAIISALWALAAWVSFKFANFLVAGALMGSRVIVFRLSMEYEKRWNQRNAEKLPPSVKALEELGMRLKLSKGN